MPEKVAMKNDYQNNPVESKGSQSASSVTTEKPEEDNLRRKPKGRTFKTNRDLYHKYVNYDHPGECSPEKDCLW